MKSDSIIDAIRAVRHRISASVNHDPKKLVEYYREKQRTQQERIVSRGTSGSSFQPTSAAEHIKTYKGLDCAAVEGDDGS